MTKLNLACGPTYLPGYINIDNNTHGKYRVDHEADIFDLHYDECTIDEILLSHFMMYIDRQSAPSLIGKFYKWLRVGGVLIVETGDLKYIAQHILSTDNPDEIEGYNGVKQLFGWDFSAGHKWAWCPETLEPIFSQVGFSDIVIERGRYHKNPSRDFIIEGIK